MELLPSSPPTNCMASMNSKKRRRSIEPLEDTKILGLQKLLLPSSPLRTIRDSLCRASKSVKRDVADADSTQGQGSRTSDECDGEDDSDIDQAAVDALEKENAATSDDRVKKANASEVLRRSLMGLSLQLKLKIMIVEAWASDMNSVVIERNLFAIAKELAILHNLRVFEEDTCLGFIDLARERMTKLLAAEERGERVKMDAQQMWTMAKMQAQEHKITLDATSTKESEFPLLSGYDASSRDISVLWNAMSIARERGAQLWHENKPEQALPFLVAADSYMKRFTLKYQRLKIDHAMLAHKRCQSNSSRLANVTKLKRVSFAEEPQVLGTADSEVDRSPISPTKPSKLESLLLRTSREFPTPLFD